ncbi:hypothetical protein BCT46_01345 [Vibrio sp. 10N.261.46.E8]|nr:hypothetical protein BCT46_01345 [Vibrio sp. 10N.261.46.E8]PMN78247.1 hypothetical protein BCT22_19475 [Vibrio sp. 10N.261.45.A1]
MKDVIFRCLYYLSLLVVQVKYSVINTLVAGLSLKLIRHANENEVNAYLYKPHECRACLQATPADALCSLHERIPEHTAEQKYVAEYQCRLFEK